MSSWPVHGMSLHSCSVAGLGPEHLVPVGSTAPAEDTHDTLRVCVPESHGLLHAVHALAIQVQTVLVLGLVLVWE